MLTLFILCFLFSNLYIIEFVYNNDIARQALQNCVSSQLEYNKSYSSNSKYPEYPQAHYQKIWRKSIYT